MLVRELFYGEVLSRNLHASPSELRRLQLEKLRRTLKLAYENVPFYNRKFRSANVKPEDISTFDDLKKIPFTTKSEIETCPVQDVISAKADAAKILWRSTSGSTGTPLNIGYDPRTVELEGALWHRALSENGFNPLHRMSTICDPRSFPERRRLVENLGLAKRQYLSIFDAPEAQLARLEEFQPDAIKAYSSSLAILADYSRDRLASLNPKEVFTTAEMLDARSRELIKSAFGCRMFDNYASTEFANMAWECSEHCGYHMNVDGLVMEFVEGGENMALGEHGEIVCTSLLNDTMPLIRYKIGDVGVPLEEECSCGVTLPLMKMVGGRADDFLVTTDGRIISPTVFFPYPFRDFDEIKQFRIIQEKKEFMVVQVSPRNGFPNKQQILREAEVNIKRLFGKEMQVEFQVLDKIERDASGKLRKVVSNVPIENYAWNHYD